MVGEPRRHWGLPRRGADCSRSPFSSSSESSVECRVLCRAGTLPAQTELTFSGVAGCAFRCRIMPEGNGKDRVPTCRCWASGQRRDTIRHQSTTTLKSKPRCFHFSMYSIWLCSVALVNSSPSPVPLTATSGFISSPAGLGIMWARYQRRQGSRHVMSHPTRRGWSCAACGSSPRDSASDSFSWPARTLTPFAVPSKCTAHCAGQPMAIESPQFSKMIR